MIDRAIIDDPRYSAIVSEFTTSIRMYWRRNVGSYFNLRSAKWGLEPKMDHRISISAGGEPRLRNAIEVKWNTETGHVMIEPAKLMIAGSGRSWNLIDILVYGTRATPKAYRVEIDKRVARGMRGPQSNDEWIAWMNVFVPYVDKKLNELTDKLADMIADNLEHEMISVEEI